LPLSVVRGAQHLQVIQADFFPYLTGGSRRRAFSCCDICRCRQALVCCVEATRFPFGLGLASSAKTLITCYRLGGGSSCSGSCAHQYLGTRRCDYPVIGTSCVLRRRSNNPLGREAHSCARTKNNMSGPSPAQTISGTMTDTPAMMGTKIFKIDGLILTGHHEGDVARERCHFSETNGQRRKRGELGEETAESKPNLDIPEKY
ncbi:hypothetical protein CRG98_026135, partial [Punica granatum]